MLYRRTTRLIPAALIVAAFVLASCETSLDPFVERDMHFSMFGFLNAAADTQYIRVTPLRRSVETDPDPLDAAISLRSMETGLELQLNEEIRSVGGGKVAHLFWTADSIATGRTYTFSATGPDGETSWAEVEVPADFPTPQLSSGVQPFRPPPYNQGIIIEGVEHLADVSVIYEYRIGAGAELQRQIVSYEARTTETSFGHVLSFNGFQDIRESIGSQSCPTITYMEVVVTSSNEEWPDLLGIDLETLAIPGAFGNVEDGIGFIGGVVSKRYPWPEAAAASRANRSLYCGP